LTYREYQVDDIHQAQDDDADLCLVIAVASNQKQACNDVVGEHLPMVLSTLFNVDNQNLLEPETKLSQIVQLKEAGHGARGERRPHGAEIVEVGGLVDEILSQGLAGAIEENGDVIVRTVPRDQNVA